MFMLFEADQNIRENEALKESTGCLLSKGNTLHKIRKNNIHNGRKHRLFSASPKGADASAAAYSIINTAQANGIDVREYLTTIFLTGERRLPLKAE